MSVYHTGVKHSSFWFRSITLIHTVMFFINFCLIRCGNFLLQSSVFFMSVTACHCVNLASVAFCVQECVNLASVLFLCPGVCESCICFISVSRSV